MKVAAERPVGGLSRAALAALSVLALASCTATNGPDLTASAPAYTVPAADSTIAIADNSADGASVASPSTDSSISATPAASDETALPQQVAFLPVGKPADEKALDAISSELKPDAEASRPIISKTTAASAPVVSAYPAGQVIENSPPADTAAAEPVQKKRGFFSMFGSGEATSPPRQTAQNPVSVPRSQAVAYAAPQQRAKPMILTTGSSKPLVNLDESSGKRPLVMKASFGDALPGVRQSALFEITRKSGLDDDSDVDLHEDEAPDTRQVASAGSLARLDPNGLLLQRETVDVACLKPDLLRMLKTVENHYGKKLVVTSGYRSVTYNHKVGGARKSMHMFCAAADVQMPGVSKWELAAYARSLQGRGGVGTYCHTESVHIDIGPERDWNWRCSRRKA